MFSIKSCCLFLLMILLSGRIVAQSPFADSEGYITVAAGKEYHKSGLTQWLWGKNQRKEWTTPVRVPVILLDTLYGGLHPYQAGGGGESKSLRLVNASGKEYTLRSINKSRRSLLKGFLKHTFYGSMVQDGISMSHPYAAFALPVMLRQANIPHPEPRLVYLPRQAALDTFNAIFANDMYLLEERPDGDWSDVTHLGNYHKYYSTEKVKEKLRDNNNNKADQQAFIKARLFDILISDVDRHQDNWRWGLADTGSAIFKPVPRDRDQAFFTFTGVLSKLSIALTRGRWMQPFNYDIKNVKNLTSPDRKPDKFFANEMNYNDWKAAAVSLQQSLTDSVIIKSIQQLPPEIYALSGVKIIGKLERRRDDLQQYAARYYKVMARKVEVNGSMQTEYFEVHKLEKDQAAVNIYRLDNQGKREATPYYHRVFEAGETRTIILYGFGGEDIFDIDNSIHGITIKVNKGINTLQYPKG